MNPGFLIILAVMGITGWLLINHRPKLSKSLMIACVMGCLYLTIQQTRISLGSAGVQRSHRAQASAGYMMATQLLKDTRLREGRILLIFPEDGEAEPAALDSFYEGFARVLTRFRKLRLEEVTIEISSQEIKSGNWDLVTLQEKIPSDQDIIACVSWVGAPLRWLDIQTGQPLPFQGLLYLQDHTASDHWTPQMIAQRQIAGVVRPRKAALPEDLAQSMTSAAEVFESTFEFLLPTSGL
ncbi:MAG: hypothetical protein ACPGL0_06215 [Limisphaerales bacterium]